MDSSNLALSKGYYVTLVWRAHSYLLLPLCERSGEGRRAGIKADLDSGPK